MQVNYYTDTREDTIDAEEYRLYEMIMDYRVSLGLPTVPLSKALTITASRHTLDTVYNLGAYDGHVWSDAPYDANDPATYPNVWFAPDRIGTGYTAHGFEISIGYRDADPFDVPDMTAQVALEGWQGSPGHNNVITQQGPWDENFQAIGVAIHESVSHVWFGREPDPTGPPEFEPGVGPDEPPVETSPPDAGEVLFGTPGDDAIQGFGGNDILYGGDGRDTLDGGTGHDVLYGQWLGERGSGDTAHFDGAAGEYTVTGGIDYAVVSDSNGERDKLFGIERIVFDDGETTLGAGSALDGLGAPEDFITAERVALLYEAALDRDGGIDTPGLNFYVRVTEQASLSDEFLADDLMNSPEFTRNFGDVDGMTNSEFLEQIYLNVLDRGSDAAGRQFYLDLLDAGTITRALALADIAISPENAVASVQVLQDLYLDANGQWGFLG